MRSGVRGVMNLQTQRNILIDGAPFEEMVMLQHIADTGIMKEPSGLFTTMVPVSGKGALR